jgi:hypothetical protein
VVQTALEADHIVELVVREGDRRVLYFPRNTLEVGLPAPDSELSQRRRRVDPRDHRGLTLADSLDGPLHTRRLPGRSGTSAAAYDDEQHVQRLVG